MEKPGWFPLLSPLLFPSCHLCGLLLPFGSVIEDSRDVWGTCKGYGEQNMPALNKQYRANGCGIHACQLLEEGEKAKEKKPRHSSRPLRGLFLCVVKLALVQQSLIFFDCGFFAWWITSPMAFACAYLQTSPSLGLTSQSLWLSGWLSTDCNWISSNSLAIISSNGVSNIKVPL